MSNTLITQGSNLDLSERSGSLSLGAPQPAFIINLKNRFKNPAVGSGGAVVASIPVDSQRSGDINVEDILPGSIQSVHIHDLSADKISAGTIDTEEITIISSDGAITITGALMSIDNASGIRQVTFGNYNGTNYGLAFGANPASPDMEMTGTIISINTVGLVNFRSGSDATFHNSGNTLVSNIGYVINQFVIQGDSTNGINLFGNGGNICLGETQGSYGGGVKVIFIPDRSAAPSSNPSGGGILYSEGGALKWRGSGGTTTVIALA